MEAREYHANKLERNTSTYEPEKENATIRRARRERQAELVVQGVLRHFEPVEAIRLGIAAAEEGRVRPARQALAELHAKLLS